MKISTVYQMMANDPSAINIAELKQNFKWKTPDTACILLCNKRSEYAGEEMPAQGIHFG